MNPCVVLNFYVSFCIFVSFVLIAICVTVHLPTDQPCLEHNCMNLIPFALPLVIALVSFVAPNMK